MGKNLWAKIKFWSKKPGTEFFLSKNNQVRLTQGGGYMTPPPQWTNLALYHTCIKAETQFDIINHISRPVYHILAIIEHY